MKTAVEFLESQYKFYGILMKTDFEQAKEIEIKQSHEYAEFSIKCDRLDMKILNFDGYIKLQNTNK